MSKILMQQADGGAGGGGAPADWRASLPEEQRGAAYLQDVKDLPTLVKNYGEALAYRGNSIRIPGPDAAPEARKEFVEKLQSKVPDLVLVADGEDDAAKAARAALWQRLGRPREAKEYGPPEGVELPESALEALRAEAAEEGLTKGQFQARAKRAAAALEAATRAASEEQAELKKELGPAYQDRIAGAAEAARRLGADPDEVKAIENGAAPAAYVRRMLAAAKALGEPRQVADQGGGARTSMTPAEAKAQRAEIMARSEYFDPRPAQLDVHRTLVAKVQALNEIIDG
jgi:hypothetical protein